VVSGEAARAAAVIARHRTSLEWLLQVPEWEEQIDEAMAASGLPGQRQGISRRAAVRALAIEHKFEVVRRVLEQFRRLLPSAVAVGIRRVAGLERFDQRELDAHLTARQWQRLRDEVRARLTSEHRAYKTAQQALFEAHEPMVARIVGRIAFRASARPDCLQEGALALLQAIDRVQADGRDLPIQAASAVRRAVKNHLMRQRLPVYAPVNLISEASLSARADERPGADGAGPDGRLLARVRACLAQPALSIDGPLSAGESSWRERMDDPTEDSPAERASRRDWHGVVRRELGALTAKQREVVERRFGLAGGPVDTLDQIARDEGISRQQASMREKRALRRLESALAPLFAEEAGHG
jgi:RNA polymerase sigma factor (sigma-70 family)